MVNILLIPQIMKLFIRENTQILSIRQFISVHQSEFSPGLPILILLPIPSHSWYVFSFGSPTLAGLCNVIGVLRRLVFLSRDTLR